MPVNLESISVETVQSGIRAEPHEAVPVLEYGIDRIVRQSVGHLQMSEHERLGR